MKEQVRIGFIGCGGNGRGHMAKLLQIPDAKLVAVCDTDRARAEQAASETKATPYTDHRRMLDEEKLDAVYLSLPVFAHGQPELDVIDRKLPFFVEKPVARTMETARRIEAAVLKAGIITCVGYQLRYTATAQTAKKLLADRTITMLEAHYWCGYGRQAKSWVIDFEKSGGQIVEQATHTIDMMRYIAGDVESVFAYQAIRSLTHTNCPDANCVVLRFKSGALGTLSTTWAGEAGDWSEANVLHVFFDQYRLRMASGAVEIVPKLDLPKAEAAYPSIDHAFVDAVKRNDPNRILSPYSDAVKSLAVSLGIIQSARENRPIVLM